MNLQNLGYVLQDEPAYRYKQIQKHIYQDLIDNWDQATSLPKSLRDELNQEVPLNIEAEFFVSPDKKTVKALIELENGKKIEAILMRHNNRNTVCLSSQVGCPMGCLFCATGQMGFNRDLTALEILEQAILFARYLKKDEPGSSKLWPRQAEAGQKINNIVFMGMGEPFLNYDNVIKSIENFNDPNGFNIGARHISISTIGIPEGIKKITRLDKQINLAVSLHAADNDLRNKIIPLNKKYPITEVIESVSDYLNKTKRKIMIEYIMIKNVNDQVEHAQELVKLLKDLPRTLYFINLIAYNPSESTQKRFKPSEGQQILKFAQILMRKKIKVTERYRFGRDIDAACGQLANRTRK